MLNLGIQTMSGFCATASPDGPAFIKSAYNLKAQNNPSVSSDSSGVSSKPTDPALGF